LIAVLAVIEQPPRQRLDELLLGEQRVGRRGVDLDPVAVVVDPPSPIDGAFGAGWSVTFHDVDED